MMPTREARRLTWEADPPRANHAEPVLRADPAPPPATLDPDAGGLDPRTLVNRVLYHWFLVLVVGSLVAGSAGIAVWMLVPPKYSTYALLQVALSNYVIEPDDKFLGRNEFVTYLKTQAQLIRSQFVLASALRDKKVASLPMILRQEDPVRWLEEELKVEFSENSEVLRVGLDGDYPEDIALIVNAVQAAYLREIIDDEQRRKQDRLVKLEEMRLKLESALKDRQQFAQTQFASATPKAPDPAIEAAAAQERLYASQLAKVQDELTRATAERATAASRLQAAKARLRQIEQAAIPTEGLDEAIKADKQLIALQAQIDRQRSKVEYYRKHVVSEDQPSFRQLTGTLATLQKQYAEIAANLHDQYIASVRKQKIAAAVAAVEQLEELTASAAEREKVLQAHLEQVASHAPKPPPTTQPPAPPSPDANLVHLDIDQRRRTLENVTNKIHDLRVELQAPPRVKPIQTATVPVRKEIKKQLMMSLFAFLGGFGLVAGCVALVEGRAARVFGPEDIRARPQFAFLGSVPRVSRPRGGRTNRKEQSAFAEFSEAIDRIRAVSLTRFGRNVQTLLVTSPSGRECKTTLAGHLALSLARTDKKTLIIDGNLRNPDLHQFLDLPREPGLCELLRNESHLSDVVRRTSVGGLYFLPAGVWDPSAREAVAKDKFRKVLDRLRHEFDYIVIDAHAVLPAADTLLMAPLADAVLVAVLRYVSSLTALEQAHERLVGVETAELGVVLMGE